MRRSITSITEEQIESLSHEGNLIDYLKDSTELRVVRYKSGLGTGVSWFRIAVLSAGGKCIEKHDARTARCALACVKRVTRKRGGCR